MAVDNAGSPLSFATPAQQALTQWLRTTTLFVPVTARSVGALFRTSLDFDIGVAAHGGVILRDRTPCPRWASRIAEKATAALPTLDRLNAAFLAAADRLGFSVRIRIIDEEGLPLYLVAKHRRVEGCDPELHAVASAVRAFVPDGWTIHVNGNNVAYIPPHLGKAAAVEALLPELRAQYPNLPVIGIGDSLTDAPFMALCDFAMAPTRSQLAATFLNQESSCSRAR
jgi:hypothetical protein